MRSSLYQLVLVHFRSFFREPAVLFWAVLFPIIMAWVLGIAFSNKGESVRSVYVVGDSIPQQFSGEQVMGTETGNPYRIRFVPATEEKAITAIKKGLTALYVKAAGDSITYYFDPANADAQLTHLIIERGENGSDSARAFRPLESKGTRYIDFLIPGLIAFGIMNACMWGIGWTLIETRMKKLMRRMVATPMKRSVFLTSHMITRVVLGGFETVMLLIFAYLYFDIEITGNPFAFVIVFLAGIFAFAGIAILVASRTAKTEVANGLVNVVTLPMMILSGIFFNYHNFPDWTIPIIRALPLTLLADSIRSIFVEAAGFAEIVKPTLMLAITGFVTFFAGLRIFKWY